MVQAGDTITLDIAFLSNDGDVFADYGVAGLQCVPAPPAWALAGIGMCCLCGWRAARPDPWPACALAADCLKPLCCCTVPRQARRRVYEPARVDPAGSWTHPRA